MVQVTKDAPPDGWSQFAGTRPTTHVGRLLHTALFEDTPTLSLARHTHVHVLSNRNRPHHPNVSNNAIRTLVSPTKHMLGPTNRHLQQLQTPPSGRPATQQQGDAPIQDKFNVKDERSRRAAAARLATRNTQRKLRCSARAAQNTLQIPRVSSKGDVFPRGGKCEAFSRTLVLNNTPPWIRTVKIEFPLVSVPYSCIS